MPPISKREIVGRDTVLGHHSFCFKIFSRDKEGRTVTLETDCSQKPTDDFLMQFFDPSRLGMRSVTWYDTSGKFIYYVRSKNNIVEECFWYHYPEGDKNYDLIIGYRKGELFKELYTWDEYGAGYISTTSITRKKIRTGVRTDKLDKYGYTIWKFSERPNKTGAVEWPR
ncbi:MAG: hypothetical protein EOP04_09305 [Proteobacteria bacterium]|nr:MAG: hypothetical protein EOP04_09305 [Pseudomonadota bacterium]